MKIIITILFISVMIVSCGKENKYKNDFFGTALFINASPGVSGTSPQPGLQIFIDTFQNSSSAIAYKGSTGYLTALPGSRKIQIRSSTDLKTNFIDLSNETFISNKASTYFIYDTLSTTSLKLKSIRLDDNLTPPDLGFINFRFLNVAVNSTPLDITFLRTSVTPNDSVTVTNQAYIGPSPASATYSPFNRKLPLGIYSIKLKSAGTQNVLITPSALTLSPFSSIYTFFATGTAAGLPLSLGAIKHYP
jgi:Domain of unknown function (DUF4397)